MVRNGFCNAKNVSGREGLVFLDTPKRGRQKSARRMGRFGGDELPDPDRLHGGAADLSQGWLELAIGARDAGNENWDDLEINHLLPFGYFPGGLKQMEVWWSLGSCPHSLLSTSKGPTSSKQPASENPLGGSGAGTRYPNVFVKRDG